MERLVSWNVNGLRAASRNGLWKWLSNHPSHVVAFQETKIQSKDFQEWLAQAKTQLQGDPRWRHVFSVYASKPGYSGVATFSAVEPMQVFEGIGIEEIDLEGRVLALEFKDYVHINAYFPNSQRDHARLSFKIFFCKEMKKFCDGFVKRGKNVILCGDYNIAHEPIDLRNPKQNENNAGFLPEERAWMGSFLKQDYVDCFRKRCPEEGHYTWWSYRPGVREKNIGWRLDYHCVNREFDERVGAAFHQPEIGGSDHCPVWLELR